jgi:hypothetical protein
VPLLWGPLLAAGVAAALWGPWAASDAGGLSAAAAQMAGGVLLWELTEYSLHRWVCTLRVCVMSHAMQCHCVHSFRWFSSPAYYMQAVPTAQ